MKKFLTFALLLLPFPLFGQATTGYHRTAQVIARGNEGVSAQIVPGAKVSVTLTSTGAAATIYSDPLLSSPIASSLVTTDISGNYGYYLPLNVCVTETISKPGGGNIVVPNVCNNSAGSSGGVIDINGVTCTVGGSCALPPFCAGPTCANLDQNNPDFATAVITTTAPITSSSLVIPVVSTAGWPSTGCGWTNGAVEGICWDSSTPTSLVLNQLSRRRGINGYAAVSHGSGTQIEGATYTLAASPTTSQLFAVSTGPQIGFNNAINPGLDQPQVFNGNTLFEAQAQVSGKLTVGGGLVLVNGPIVTTFSSSTGTQAVNCAPGGSAGQFCDPTGAWLTPSSGGGISGLTTGFLPQATSPTAIGDSPIDNAITNFGVLTSALPLYVNPTDGNDQTSFVISGEVTGQNSSIFDVNAFNGIQLLSVTGDGTINPGWVNAFIGLELGNRNDGLAYLPNSVCADNYGAVTYDSIGCINFLGANGTGPNGIAINAVIQGSGVGSNTPQITFGISSSSTTATTIATIDQTGLELNYLTPSTSALCYPTGSPAVVTNVGCTGGGLSGLTTGFIPIATSSSTVGNSLLDYNISSAGDFTFGAPALLPVGSEVNGSAICTTATGCGSASLTLTTTGTTGAATFLSGVLNIPVYVAPTGQYLALDPALGTPQFVITQPGDSTTFLQTSVGNVSSVNPNIVSMFSYGQGYNCGNDNTSCTGWSTQNTLTLNNYTATRGIDQGLKLNCDKNAIGDFNCIYGYPECFGGGQEVSGERCSGMTLQMLQSPWFNGAVVTPSVGTLSGAHGPSTSGLTYIWVGGNSAPVIFPASGAVQSFSVTYTANTSAQTIQIGLATPNGFGSFTLGTPVPESLPSLTCSTGSPCVETWTPALTAAAGQTIYYYQATGNSPANGSFAGAAFSGAPSAGTFSTSTASGLLMTASLAAPTTGAVAVTVSSLNCNVNCTNPRIGSNFADGGIIINTTETTSAVTLGTESTILNGLSYALTSGTVPVSTAWGNIIPGSCTGNGNGQYQAYTATTCTITLGVSPASPGHFTTSGGITTCPAVATSPGTSADIHLSGPFTEEAYIIAVTTGSTTDSVTFCTRYAYNQTGSSTRVMQGGPQSEAFVSNAAVSAGWPVAYPIDGAFTSTQLAFSNCLNGACNQGGNILASGTAVTIYSAAFITGSGNGAVNTATVGTTDWPVTVGDNLVGAPSSEVSMEGIRLVCGQWTAVDGAEASSCLQMADSGGSRMTAMIRLENSGSSGAPGATMIDADTGFWFDTIKLANAPTSYLVDIQNHSQTTNGIVKYDDSFGALTFVDTGASAWQEILNWTEAFNAADYSIGGSFGTLGQVMTSGGPTGLTTWSTPTSGTVTSVSVTTANGVSGSVATATTTPAITLTLGAINPTSTGQTTAGPGSFTTLTATSGLAIGTSPPTACAGLSGCGAFAEAGTSVTPAAGVDTIRADTTHLFKLTLNGGSEFTSLMNFSTVNLASSAAGGVSGALPNSSLANPFTTVNGQTCTLGGSCTVATAVSNPVSSTIPGSGISSVSCSTAACTNLRGTYTMTATTVSAGAILTLVWPTTTTAYACSVSQNGGATSLGLSHSVATATGMSVSVAVSVATGSITFDYSCQP